MWEKRWRGNFSFYLAKYNYTAYNIKISDWFLIIISTKIYIDNTERKDNYYVCCKV